MVEPDDYTCAFHLLKFSQSRIFKVLTMKPFHVHSLRCLNPEEQDKQAAAIRTHSWISGKAAREAKCSNRVGHGISEVGSHNHV